MRFRFATFLTIVLLFTLTSCEKPYWERESLIGPDGAFIGGPREYNLTFYPGTERCRYCIGTSIDGKSREVMPQSKPGPLTLVPSTDQVAYGENIATFTLSLEGDKTLATQVTLEIYSTITQTTIAHRLLKTEDFRFPLVSQDFSLPFLMTPADHTLQFHVIWHGGTRIRHSKTTIRKILSPQRWVFQGKKAALHQIGSPSENGGWAVSLKDATSQALAVEVFPESLARGSGMAAFYIKSLYRISTPAPPSRYPVLKIEMYNRSLGLISSREIQFRDLNHQAVKVFELPFYNPGVAGDPLSCRLVWGGGAPLELVRTVLETAKG